MKKIFALALSLIYIIGYSQNENSLLYKITGNGIKSPSYIFGTIHLSCEVFFDEATQNALNETSQLFLEIDMDDPQLQAKMMSTLYMKDGVTMSSLISEEEFILLDDFLRSKMNISAKSIDNYKPFFISSMLLPSMFDCKTQSYETELVHKFTNTNRPIFGLETIEEQMDIFDKIPYQIQIKELITSIKDNFESDKLELKLMQKSHKEKNLIEIQRLIKESKSSLMNDFDELFLANRNKKWIPIIYSKSLEKPTFFGFGAAHLLGEDGVINLLRKKGFKVEPL
ncbi:TraB/GumN family protein [Flavobacterium sp.]|uniref:TraB/GumN family protein n=1 Tax=Flavobacterium sp. TaxID=239 RepID=UPI002601B586|nr:TraB/GumN family protein [Flavobacterium sp.]MDD3003930.1 TraB/GumN family protein [Flavobacterium sp.]